MGNGPLQVRFREVVRGVRGLSFLFAGPPGTGKTAVAHAVGFLLGMPLLEIKPTNVLLGNQPVRMIFKDIFMAEWFEHAIVLFDDCESFFKERNEYLLIFLDAWDRFNGITILTTNIPSVLDHSVMRRVSLRVDFTMPSPELREEIWELCLPPEVPLSDDIHVPTLATTYEFTGAEIKKTVLLALCKASEQRKDSSGNYICKDEGR